MKPVPQHSTDTCSDLLSDVCAFLLVPCLQTCLRTFAFGTLREVVPFHSDKFIMCASDRNVLSLQVFRTLNILCLGSVWLPRKAEVGHKSPSRGSLRHIAYDLRMRPARPARCAAARGERLARVRTRRRHAASRAVLRRSLSRDSS